MDVKWTLFKPKQHYQDAIFSCQGAHGHKALGLLYEANVALALSSITPMQNLKSNIAVMSHGSRGWQ